MRSISNKLIQWARAKYRRNIKEKKRRAVRIAEYVKSWEGA